MASAALDLRRMVGRQSPATSHVRLAPWQEFAVPRAVVRWDHLSADASEANPFFEGWYLLPALRAFAADGSVDLLVFERDGELAGLMPVARARSYERWPFPHLGNWVHANCFLGSPLVQAGLEEEFWTALFDHADSEAGLALFLHLHAMPLEGPLHAALEAVCERQGRPWGTVAAHRRAVLESDLAPDDYRQATLSKRRCRDLRRHLARLRDKGEVRFVWQEGAEDIERWIEDFLQIESLGWKGARGSALACHESTRALFTESLREGASRNRLIRLALTLDGRPVAMLVNFLAKPGSFGFKTAFDPEFAAYSPGILLECEYLATLSRDDIDWCDSCAAADHTVLDRLWTGRRRVGRVSIGIGGPARRTLFAGLLRAELSRNPEGVR